jgi:D-3-phosphoglycerate dehydrogenase / 2-oxoglutarate reductase
MPRCLIVQPIHARGVELLAAASVECVHAATPDPAVVARDAQGVEAIIVRASPLPIDAARAPRLRVIAKHGVGVDNIPIAAASERGVTVVYTPGANARSTAEQAIALMLACARLVPAADRALRAGDWGFRYRPGVELFGKTLGR